VGLFISERAADLSAEFGKGTTSVVPLSTDKDEPALAAAGTDTEPAGEAVSSISCHRPKQIRHPEAPRFHQRGEGSPVQQAGFGKGTTEVLPLSADKKNPTLQVLKPSDSYQGIALAMPCVSQNQSRL